MLVNMMEKFVDDALQEMLEGEDCCKCERCLEDMKAIALNKLPAQYVSSHNGALFSKINSIVRQNSVDIRFAVANAIECVSKNPAHPPLDKPSE